MPAKLDEDLISRMRRRVRKNRLSLAERVALNYFWRKKVPVPVLAKVFRVSKNTIYYKALTGTADSYPNSDDSNSAAETNAILDKLGLEEAKRRYVTDKWIQAVNEENQREHDRLQK